MPFFGLLISAIASTASTALASSAQSDALKKQLEQQKQEADAKAALTEKYLRYGLVLSGLMVTAIILRH